MSRIQVSDMPPNALVWQRAVAQEDDIRGLVVPPGHEVVLYHGGDYLGPYREGDSPALPKSGGIFRRRKAENARLYVCRRQLPRPLYWGLGELPAPGGGVFGASGQLRLSLSNALALVRSLALDQSNLDDTALTRHLETLVMGSVRPALVGAVSQMGLAAAQDSYDLLAEQVRQAIAPGLRELGLMASSLLVENLVIKKGPA